MTEKTGEKMFRPMLAADCKGDLTAVKFPVLVSPKIDGIRAIVRDGKLLSRSLKPIPNKAIRAALERPEFEGFDGELIFGDGRNFQATTSKVMSPNEDAAGVQYCVFDLCDYDAPFAERLQELKADLRAASERGPHTVPVMLVPHLLCPSEVEVLKLEAECLADGFEGAMLRDPAGAYKCGRSTVKEGGLLKLKRFEDAEATIVGFVEEMHNTNEATTNELGRTKRSSAQAGKVGKDTLGAFVVTMMCDPGDPRDVTFNVGSGFTAAQRAGFWHNREGFLGKVIKFKHLPHGAKDAPRHPVFLGFRAAEDMSQ